MDLIKLRFMHDMSLLRKIVLHQFFSPCRSFSYAFCMLRILLKKKVTQIVPLYIVHTLYLKNEKGFSNNLYSVKIEVLLHSEE
jgi:hypothetical protein